MSPSHGRISIHFGIVGGRTFAARRITGPFESDDKDNHNQNGNNNENGRNGHDDFRWNGFFVTDP